MKGEGKEDNWAALLAVEGKFKKAAIINNKATGKMMERARRECCAAKASKANGPGFQCSNSHLGLSSSSGGLVELVVGVVGKVMKSQRPKVQKSQSRNSQSPKVEKSKSPKVPSPKV